MRNACHHGSDVHTLRTINVSYPTANSPPPPTTHHALNVCEALRCPSLCEARDVKDEDKLVHMAYLAGKQLPAVMCLKLRNRSPYLMPWMDCICCARNICYGLNEKEVMLAHCWGKQDRNHEVAAGSTTSMRCKFSPHGRWRYTSYFIALMLRKGGMVWASIIYLLNFRRWYGSPLISEPWVVFNLK